MKRLCFILFLGIYNYSEAQNCSELITKTQSLLDSGQVEEALEVAISSEKICRSSGSGKDSSYATCLFYLGACHKEVGNLEDALKFFSESLEIGSKVFSEDNLTVVETKDKMAATYVDLGNYGDNFEKSRLLYLDVLEKRREIQGTKSLAYAETLNDLAVLYDRMSQYEKSLPLFLEVAEITKELYGEKHDEYVISLEALAVTYGNLGQVDQAIALYTKAAGIIKEIFGERHENYAISLSNLASAYDRKGDHKKAVQLAEQAFELRKVLFGANSRQCAGSLNQVGQYYLKIGSFQKALDYLNLALEIRDRNDAKKNYYYSINLLDIADTHFGMGNYKDALTFLNPVLEIRKKALGENHGAYLSALNRLAQVYLANGEYEKSLAISDSITQKLEKILGLSHPAFVNSLVTLGDIFVKMNRHKEAQNAYSRAIEYFKNSHLEKHLNYAHALMISSNIKYIDHQEDSAVESYLLASATYKNHVQSTLASLSEEEQMNFIQSNNLNFQNLLSVAMTSGNLQLLTDCFNNELLLKGLALESIAQLTNAILQSEDSIAIRELKNYRELRNRYTIETAKLNSDKKLLNTINDQLQITEKKLQQISPEYQEFAKAKRVNYADIATALKDNEAAIEFVDFRFWNKTWSDSIYYAALIVRKGWSAPRLIRLFEKRQLEEILSKTRAKPELLYGDKSTNPAAINYSSQLYQIIWKPIDSLLEGIETIYMAPSGLLHKISFAAIQISPIKKLIDRYKLRLVMSTRVLASKNYFDRRFEIKSAQLYGGIEYDKEADKKFLANDKVGFENDLVADFRNRRGSVPENWGYLSGTGMEVDAIKKLLTKNSIEAFVHTGRNASEEEFRTIISGSKDQFVLHMATHGFSLPLIVGKTNEKSQRSGNTYVLAKDPLLRTGLLLSGANKAWKTGSAYVDREDGILTGYELSNQDLKKCQLAILSACETGVGDITGNEGVFGLQRALKKAGVKNMIVTLWKIDDLVTVEFMTSFYQRVLKNNNINIAFAETQKEIRTKYVSPHYWAGFILIE